MAAFTKFQKFVEALAHKKHNLGTDQIKIALSSVAPNATTAGELGDITEIAYTNLSAREVTTAASAQAAGTYKLVLSDLVLTASGNVAPFRYVTLYNETATNDDLIAFFDYGSSISMVNGETFTIDFDAALGILTIV